MKSRLGTSPSVLGATKKLTVCSSCADGTFCTIEITSCFLLSSASIMSRMDSGGGVGATLGAIAAIGTTLALPGLGLLIAGPIAAALAGGGAGALTGGLVGALIGHGIPEEQAKQYEQGIREGGIVMGVQPRSDEDADYFENNWRRHRGESIYR